MSEGGSTCVSEGEREASAVFMNGILSGGDYLSALAKAALVKVTFSSMQKTECH